MTSSQRHGRTKVRHPLRVRTLDVVAVRDVSAHMRRVTLASGALDGFVSLGPTDHLKIFLADPDTGLVTVPEVDDDGGLHVPSGGVPLTRDLTPRAFRPADGPETAQLDVDVVVHGEPGPDAGPLATWILVVRPGDQVAVAGPRGSKVGPEGYSRFVLGADETGLPSVARWLELLPEDVQVLVLAEVKGPGEEPYLDGVRDGIEVRWLARGEAMPGDSTVLAEAFAAAGAAGEIDAETFVWAGGEAGSLVAVRRYLRRELGLGPAQAEVQGYWRRGVRGFDHHAPVDPADPD